MIVFEWDIRKAIANYEKHKISFEEAVTAFSDAKGLDGDDVEHSHHEHRRQRIAKSIVGRVIFVVYTIRRRDYENETIRIISARQASWKERKAYARFAN